MSPQDPVLAFGPTGACGSAAAIEAHRRGAKVYLAMRDPKKELKGIQEKGNEETYIRVQADLSKPETLKQAVEKSGAKTAFVYCVFESQDSMRSSFDALKEAGVTYVVLLSSFKVQDPPNSEENTKEMIGAVHAKCEVALQESGLAYTAVRPAFFNSNIFWGVEEIKKGEVEILYPNVRYDYLAPSDIGTVCGALLVEASLRKEAGQSFYLCGPELLTQRDAHAVIGKTLGKEIKVKEIDEQRWFEKMAHMPKPVLDSLVGGLRESNEGNDMYSSIYEKAVENLRKYLEKEPLKLGEWVEQHKQAFA
jgi:uncharacterized protein YbjT (DUF2867 family)